MTPQILNHPHVQRLLSMAAQLGVDTDVSKLQYIGLNSEDSDIHVFATPGMPFSLRVSVTLHPDGELNFAQLMGVAGNIHVNLYGYEK